MPPNSQLLAENREIIYADPERRGHEQKSWTDNISPDWSLYAYERTRRAAHRPRQRLSAKPT